MARREGARTQRTLLWLAVVIVFVAYLIWALRGEEIFRVANKKLEYTAAGVIVSGEIRNTTAAASAANIEVTFFDAQGRQLSKEVIILDNLEAEATVGFRTQPKMLADVRNYTIYVNTNRNMYGN